MNPENSELNSAEKNSSDCEQEKEGAKEEIIPSSSKNEGVDINEDDDPIQGKKEAKEKTIAPRLYSTIGCNTAENEKLENANLGFALINNMSNIAAIEEYAKRGLKMVTLHGIVNDHCTCSQKENCSSPGKHPRFSDWQKEENCDPKKILQEFEKFPNSNLGLMTGEINKIVSIDVDFPISELSNEDPFFQELIELQSQTASFETGRGSQIIMKTTDEKIPNSVSKLAPKVDVRGNGGIIVVPPSVHQNGKIYRWANDRKIGELSDSLKKKIQGSLNAEHNPSAIWEEGVRNVNLYHYGVAKKRAGLTDDEIEEAIREENKKKCFPPLPNKEVKLIIKNVQKTGKQSSPKNSLSVEESIDLLKENCYFFRSTTKILYVRIKDDFNRVVEVESNNFKLFLRSFFWKHFHSSLSKESIERICQTIIATAGGSDWPLPFEEVFLRVGGDYERVFFDLNNSLGEIVEITPEGYKVISNSNINFLRNSQMSTIPYPEAGGNLDQFKEVFCLKDKETAILLLAFLLICLSPKGPYAILLIQGEHGSAKSTRMKWAKRLIDPTEDLAPGIAPSTRDLQIRAKDAWLLDYDNISFVSDELSDVFCRLVSGSGFNIRKLYTDTDQIRFWMQRPVVMNGIGEIGSRADFLNRTIIIDFPPISMEDRLPERELQEKFQKESPKILGFLFQLISTILANLPKVTLTRMPRLADAVKWVSACEEKLGLNPGEFEKIFEESQKPSPEEMVHSCDFGRIFFEWVIDEQIKEEKRLTATDLWKTLKNYLQKTEQRVAKWPSNPRALSSQLSRINSALRALGLNICSHRGKERQLIIKPTPEFVEKYYPKFLERNPFDGSL
ncbi:MAG: bifunctional DNA primase/polymerase [Candidatus Riflebacteria bacterium]|nr:bifunctional DNA primase/polymerase [Candidatus Riflebacteria bacterium]